MGKISQNSRSGSTFSDPDAKLRWSKFWWKDWQGDQALRSCSPAARGVWMDLLALAHEGEPYGHVTINSRPVSMKRLAAIVGVSEKTTQNLVDELREAGVFSETEQGVIYSRRMVRDKAASEKGRKFGKEGGNPDLLKKDNNSGYGGGLTPPVDAPLKLEAEAEAEAEVEEEESCLKTLPPSFFHGTVNENPAANDAQNTAPPQAAPPTAKRGSRLSEDWQPTDELRAYATALGLDADQVAENFRNYWSAVPGAKGLKLNWSGTFKNSCLASKDRGQYLAKTTTPNGHAAPASAVRLPEVWDDDEIWAPFCDGTSMWKDPEGTTSRNGLRPSVNGWCLPEAAKTVAKAAKLPHTFNDWRPLIGWLNDGFIITVDIRDVIRSIAARPGYQPPRSLAYFDKAVRSNSTEWDHTREPKAKPGAQFTQH